MRRGGTLSYLLADHLGSTTAVLDASGNVVSSRRYWPYGAERALSGDARATDQWYTGQRDEDFDGLGLYNYKARMYSTVTGRFVSADTVAVDGLNRYTYARGNPLRYADPTSRCVLGLRCSPSSALSWLACANSVDGCAAAFHARDIDAEPDLVERVHRLAKALVPGEEFQNNFSDSRFNPYLNGKSLASVLKPYGLNGDPVFTLFTFANSVVEEMLGLEDLTETIWRWATDPYQVATGIQMGAGAVMGVSCLAAANGGGAIVCGISASAWGVATVVKITIDGERVRNGDKDLAVALLDNFQGAISPLYPNLSAEVRLLITLQWFALKRAAEHIDDLF